MNEFGGVDCTLGSLRTEPAPKHTIKCYKLVRLVDGNIYPLFIDRSAPLQFGTWYNADSPNFSKIVDLPFGNYLVDCVSGDVLATQEKNPSKEQIKEATASANKRWIHIIPAKTARRFGVKKLFKNWGITISSGKEVTSDNYSLRAGWHAGQLPVMNQISEGKKNEPKYRNESYVWTECEISADIDYTEEAQRNPEKDLPTKLAVDGYYIKATNVNKKASQAKEMAWYVAGAIKFNRFVGDLEAREIIDDYNRANGTHIEYDYPRRSGKLFNAETRSLEGAEEKKAHIENLEDIEYLRFFNNAEFPYVIDYTIKFEKRENVRYLANIDGQYLKSILHNRQYFTEYDVEKKINEKSPDIIVECLYKGQDSPKIIADVGSIEEYIVLRLKTFDGYPCEEKDYKTTINNTTLCNAKALQLILDWAKTQKKEPIGIILKLEKKTIYKIYRFKDGFDIYQFSYGKQKFEQDADKTIDFAIAYYNDQLDTTSNITGKPAKHKTRNDFNVTFDYGVIFHYEDWESKNEWAKNVGSKEAQADSIWTAWAENLKKANSVEEIDKALLYTKESKELEKYMSAGVKTMVREVVHNAHTKRGELIDKEIEEERKYKNTIGYAEEELTKLSNRWGKIFEDNESTLIQFLHSGVVLEKSNDKIPKWVLSNKTYSYTLSQKAIKEKLKYAGMPYDEFIRLLKIYADDEDNKWVVGQKQPAKEEKIYSYLEMFKNLRFDEIKEIADKGVDDEYRSNLIKAKRLIDGYEKGIFKIGDNGFLNVISYDEALKLDGYIIYPYASSDNNDFPFYSVAKKIDEDVRFGRLKLEKRADGYYFVKNNAETSKPATEPKFKVGDLVRMNGGIGNGSKVSRVTRKYDDKGNVKCFMYDIEGWNGSFEESELELATEIKPASSEDSLSDSPVFLVDDSAKKELITQYENLFKEYYEQYKTTEDYKLTYQQASQSLNSAKLCLDFNKRNQIDYNEYNLKESIIDWCETNGWVYNKFYAEKLLKDSAENQAKIDACNEIIEKFVAYKPKSVSQYVREELVNGNSLDFNDLKKLVDVEKYGIDKVLQEAEYGIKQSATDILSAHPEWSVGQCFEQMKQLYVQQPKIEPTGTTSLRLQQYSTPLPISYLAGVYAMHGNNDNMFYEPTAGNGLLTIALPPEKTIVNELGQNRIENLKDKSNRYYSVQNCDAVDVDKLNVPKHACNIVMNPPFAPLGKKETLVRSGKIGEFEIEWEFKKLDYKIALLTLENYLAINGRCALIVGGKLCQKFLKDEEEVYWDSNGNLNGQFGKFISYLNRNYLIDDILYIDGKLYSKQGTTFTIVMILIRGKREYWNSNPSCTWRKYDSIKDKFVQSFDELMIRMRPYLAQNDHEAYLERMEAKAVRLERIKIEKQQ